MRSRSPTTDRLIVKPRRARSSIAPIAHHLHLHDLFCLRGDMPISLGLPERRTGGLNPAPQPRAVVVGGPRSRAAGRSSQPLRSDAISSARESTPRYSATGQRLEGGGTRSPRAPPVPKPARPRQLRRRRRASSYTIPPGISFGIGMLGRDEEMLALCLRRCHPGQDPRRDYAGPCGSARARGSTFRRRFLPYSNHPGCRPLDRLDHGGRPHPATRLLLPGRGFQPLPGRA